MNHYIKFINQNIHYFIFFLFFILIIGLNNNYGFSWDEELSRLNGIVSFNYILEKLNILDHLKFQNIPKLNNYIDNEYGVFFEVLSVSLEKFLQINEKEKIFYFRHILNSIFFFIGSIYFYYTLNLFYSRNISILGFIIFILHPRIFAQSFYNSKDIIFLVFFCISNFYLINYFITRKIKFLFILSIITSFAIGTRVMGLIIPFLFIIFFIFENLEKNKFKIIFLIFPFLLMTFLFTILFWPYLWENPLNIVLSLTSMSNYDWKGLVFFENTYYSAKYLPWYYLPKTILITTPLLHILLFIIGSFFIIKFLIKNIINLENNNNIWKSSEELFCVYSLTIVFLTIVIIIELSSTLYGGWRQVFFIYPSAVFICIYGLNRLLEFKNFKKGILIIVNLMIFAVLFWNIKNHPYQYTFYNKLLSKDDIKSYELDYWGVSNLNILNKILEITKNKEAKIFVRSVSPYKFSLNMINKNMRKKLIFVDDIKNAQFIVTNHYYQKEIPIVLENNLKNDFKLIYEIKSNNVSINSIYKKK